MGARFALLALGTTLVIVHRETDAIAPLEEGATSPARATNASCSATRSSALGWAHIGQHDFAGAPGPLGEALHLAIGLANLETVARALDAFAAMAVQTGDASRGAILFGAAAGMRRSVGADVWQVDRTDHADTAERLQASLGDQTYQQLTEQGATLALDEVLDITAGAARDPVAARDKLGSGPPSPPRYTRPVSQLATISGKPGRQPFTVGISVARRGRPGRRRTRPGRR